MVVKLNGPVLYLTKSELFFFSLPLVEHSKFNETVCENFVKCCEKSFGKRCGTIVKVLSHLQKENIVVRYV